MTERRTRGKFQGKLEKPRLEGDGKVQQVIEIAKSCICEIGNIAPACPGICPGYDIHKP